MSSDELAAELAIRTHLAVEEEQQELARARNAFEAELASARAQAAAELTAVRAQAAAELALVRAEAASELATVRAQAAAELELAQSATHGELIQLAGEIARLREDLGRIQTEKAVLEQAFRHAVKTLNDLRKSRGYWLMRRLGRWDSLDRGIRRATT